MGKKYTIAAVAAIALLLAAIGFAVARLYTNVPEQDGIKVSTSWEVLRAVPSDAVAVLVLDGSRQARSVIADSTGFLAPVIAPGNAALMQYLSAVGANRTAVSFHNSGALVPLVITSTERADSALLASYRQAAREAGLKSAVKENFLIASRSETFVNASVRHLEEGVSVLGRMSGLTGHISGAAVMFLSHSNAGKLLQTYASPSARKKASFVGDLTSWSAISVQDLAADHITLRGVAFPGESAASYFAAFAGTPRQEAVFPEVSPYNISSAVSVPVADAENLVEARRAYEDGKGRLNRYNSLLKNRGGRELTPLEWFKALQPKEVVRVGFRSEDGVLRDVLLLRSARDLKLEKESRNAYSGCLGDVMGEPFHIQDSVCSALSQRWSVFGDLPSVRAFQTGDYSLKDRLGDASVPQAAGFTAYASLTDAPEVASAIFSDALAAALKDYVLGSGFAPAFVSADLSGAFPQFKVRLDKRVLKGTKVQVMERDTVVVVPTGLFPVTNSATGKTNYLYQNSHKALCLNDENGRGIWGIPFKETICGRVCNIDYYHNGKIQFLFAAGTKIYLLDRLGHWVNDFPVELGREVLLGPDCYDFTGAGGYTVMILHKDGGLERYNLHGRKPEGWKGISAPETIKNLPELLEAGDKRYWAVRTSVRTIIYPFDGGGPLVLQEGGKMIKPDAVLTPTSKGVKAECYDGRIRDFKLD